MKKTTVKDIATISYDSAEKMLSYKFNSKIFGNYAIGGTSVFSLRSALNDCVLSAKRLGVGEIMCNGRIVKFETE